MNEKASKSPPQKARLHDQGEGASLFAVDYITALAELVDKHHLAEIEVRGDKLKLTVRGAASAVQMVAPAQHVMPMPAQSPQPLPPETSAVSSTPAPAPEAKAHGDEVTSPMVGTAYLSPEPGAAPFISVGATVKAGDPLMIVEAMKMMNQISAEQDGTVHAILVSDGQPVEYGQPLIRIG